MISISENSKHKTEKRFPFCQNSTNLLQNETLHSKPSSFHQNNTHTAITNTGVVNLKQ